MSKGHLEKCANCGVLIGKLETAFVWKDEVVCGSCYARLRAGDELTAAVVPQRGTGGESDAAWRAHVERRERLERMAEEEARTMPALPPGSIICPNPNCRYAGPPVRRAKGSRAVLYILLLLWVLPGLIYLILYQGYALHCPRCGVKVRDE